jgi:arsenate reductase
MAEAFLNSMAPDIYEAESAGLEAGTLNPNVIEVMKEAGIDISQNKTKKVFDFLKNGKMYSYVITVCDETSAERCPVFPGVTTRLHWSFPDPSSFTGERDEVLMKTRQVRDAVRQKVSEWIKETQS